jgi:hypothetical protein
MKAWLSKGMQHALLAKMRNVVPLFAAISLIDPNGYRLPRTIIDTFDGNGNHTNHVLYEYNTSDPYS